MKKNSKYKWKFASKKPIKLFALFVAIFFLIFMLAFLGVIIWKSFDIVKEFGFKPWSFDFDDVDGIKGGIFNSIAISIIIAIFTLIFSIPLSIKSAVLITFRLNNKVSKIIKLIVKIIGSAPSVIFALYALNVLTNFTHFMFNSFNGKSFIACVLMFIIFNSAVLINNLVNCFDSINFNQQKIAKDLWINSTLIIYKLLLKSNKKQILKCCFTAFVKVVGEASAASFIMISNNSYNLWFSGKNFFSNSVKPAATMVTTNFFAFKSRYVKEYLFALSLTLIIMIGVINFLITLIMKTNSFKTTYKDNLIILSNKWNNGNNKESKRTKIYDNIQKSIEWLFFTIIGLLIISVFVYILIFGFLSVIKPTSTIKFGVDTTLWSMSTTLYGAIWTAIIVIPFSLMVSLYFERFSRKTFFSKLINSLLITSGGLPSLVHGLFAYGIFIHLFGWTLDKGHDSSLLAGVASVVVLLIPVMIKQFNNGFKKINKTLIKQAANKGLSNQKIFFKLVLPLISPTIFNCFFMVLTLFVAEASPFLLTSGRQNSRVFSLLYPQQTLTTRMVAELNKHGSNSGNVMLECAFIAILLTSLFSLITHFATPLLNVKMQEKVKVYLIKNKIAA
ncbi:ABC transporter permease subunit [Mycoplasma zalophidermidis]|uniref:ABC transporter permease subunit n=1 Tax=Mycoplasma zalophidermidis TaxID=398174 RepID=UPI00215C9E1F|nr:ABC transporter permease subunit [Mycoplasma zalophidermidis]MCR8966293.1 ABC transporter permease subunit [Mycoplasma zalophidermidis]